jgi:hypothetical protein
MDLLASLWLPIIVVPIVLFFASFLAWAILPHHKPDWKKWPDEDALLKAVRESGAEPGLYLFPNIPECDMKNPDNQKLYARGPWGVVSVWPSKPNMGRNMALTVLYFFVVTFFIAYLASVALPAGASFARVLQVVGTAGLLAYCAGGILQEIWFTVPLRAKVMNLLDGISYGLITAVLFGLLWPGA